jgi:phosphoribosyl-AMP cyclohydrolase
MSKWDKVVEKVKFDEKGLVTAVAVDKRHGDVVMLAYMNEESLRLTLETGTLTYWSRSRQELWLKGGTSGNIQKMVSARIDCDGDALVFEVEPEGVGAACHEGYRSCFSWKLEGNEWVRAGGEPLFDPKEVYKK